MRFLSNLVCLLAVTLHGNHHKTRMHTNNVDEDIQIIEIVKHKLLDTVNGDAVISASRKTLKCKVEEIFHDHSIGIIITHGFKLHNEPIGNICIGPRCDHANDLC